MTSVSQNRFPFAAVRAFLAKWYCGVIGYESRRKRLLGTLWIKQKSFNTGGREITALEAARSPFMQPVIFLHGVAGTAIDWQWFLKKAADRFNVVAPDRPGYGPADRLPPDINRDMPILADILKHYTTEDHKPIVVGHSLGAAIAVSLAAKHPDLVGGLLLVSADLAPPKGRCTADQKISFRFSFSWLLPGILRNGNKEILQSPEFLRLLQSQMGQITCPVTVIHAEGDHLAGCANLDYIKNNCTHAARLNSIILKSGGHFLYKTKPREILKALEDL